MRSPARTVVPDVEDILLGAMQELLKD